MESSHREQPVQPEITPQGGQPASQVTGRDFEDLTLAEVFGELIRAPRATLKSLALVTAPVRRQRGAGSVRPAGAVVLAPTDTLSVADRSPARRRTLSRADTFTLARLGLYLLAVVVAWVGNSLYVATPTGLSYGLPEVSFASGAIYLGAAFLLVLVAEIVLQPGLPFLRRGGQGKTDSSLTDNPALRAQPETVGSVRLLVLPAALLAMAGAYALNGNNAFTLPGVVAWVAGIGLMILAWAPPDWQLLTSIQARITRVQTFIRQEPATLLTVLLITGLASFIRLQYLDMMLPEMTSDHVEKLLDAQEVSDGARPVFMEGNGGREIAQFYLLALIDQIPGVDLDFMALKILAALEAIITIPVFWWLGKELVGTMGGDRRLANWTGIALALVGSVAFWHIQVARVALRIILTPLVGSLLLIYVARMMRHNRRADYLKAGVILGFGLYTYQAVRMMPLLVLAGVGLALLYYARNWRTLRAYTLNLTALVLVALAVFMPLFRYSVQYSESFWSRTSGRLTLEDRIVTTNELGQTITHYPTSAERLEALRSNLGKLGQNFVVALGMFNYRGDRIYLHNAARYPHLDPLLGALLIVGVAGWLVYIVRKRDPVALLVPVGVLLMLLPTALSIAAPNENPSATRASGAMPLVLFLVAFGVVSIYRMLISFFAGRAQQVVGLVVSALLVVGVYNYTSWVVFVPYRTAYYISWHVNSEGGRIMHGFAESGGAYGNTFILRYPYWWDYRAVAIEAGVKPGYWSNGDISLESLPQRMADARDTSRRYPLDANKDLLIFYHPDDTASLAKLQEWFPDGYSTLVETSIPEVSGSGPGIRLEDKDFAFYRVPALGAEGFVNFLAAAGIR